MLFDLFAVGTVLFYCIGNNLMGKVRVFLMQVLHFIGLLGIHLVAVSLVFELFVVCHGISLQASIKKLCQAWVGRM